MGIFDTLDKIAQLELAGHKGEAKVLREQFNASKEADRVRLLLLGFAMGKFEITDIVLSIGAMLLTDLRKEIEDAKRD